MNTNKRFNLQFKNTYEGRLANEFIEKMGDSRSKSDFIAACISDYLVSLGITDVSNLSSDEVDTIAKSKLRNIDRTAQMMMFLSKMFTTNSQQSMQIGNANSTETTSSEEKIIKPIIKENEKKPKKSERKTVVDTVEDDFYQDEEEFYSSEAPLDNEDDVLSMLDDFN